MNTDEDALVSAAMQIIILAGDARRPTFEAADALAGTDFSGAAELLEQAQGKVREAHTIHTDCIQASAAGEPLAYSMLFTHAQDTLMTVNSEYRLMKKMATLFERLGARLDALERTVGSQPEDVVR